MKCTICRGGETENKTTTVTLQRGETVIVIKDVPADVCQNCGEYYLNNEVAQKVYTQAQSAAERNSEVEIAHFAA